MLGWRLGFAALLPLYLVGCSSEGSAPKLGNTTQPIVGGVLDTTTKAVVAITDDYSGTEYGFCSGSLLAPNLVLTARHCVADILGEDANGGIDCATTSFAPVSPYATMHVSIQDDITSGASLTPSLLYGTQAVRVPTETGVCSHDLALIILKGSGIPSNVAPPFEPRLDSPPAANSTFTASGYGIQDPDDQYAATYGQRKRFDGAKVYCAGDACPGTLVEVNEWAGEAPTCSGDSGGPAIDANQRVMGALSRGDDACTFAIYTGTDGFSDFIKAGAVEAATLAGTAPPDWAADAPPPTDAGTPPPEDAGTTPDPDAGTTPEPMDDAGTPSSDAGGGRPLPGISIDPLGSSCNGDCPGNYACYAVTGTPPGICVPRCGAHLNACPDGYECSAKLAACVPATEKQRKVESCSVASSSFGKQSSSRELSLLFLLGLLFARRSRPPR